MSVRVGLSVSLSGRRMGARRLVSRTGSGVLQLSAQPAAETRACWGFCKRCNGEHSLPRSQAADEAAASLLHSIRASGRLDFDAAVPEERFLASTKLRSAEFPRQQGQMLGVLLARDAQGQQHTLKAFSGQMNGAWLVHGWAEPLSTLRHDTHAAYTLAFARVVQLGEEAAAAQAQARALSGEPRLHKGWEAEPQLAALEERRVKARRGQRAVSQALLARIRESTVVTNFRGGTGDCCATKLLNAAAKVGWKPESLSEFWFGSAPPAGGRTHAQSYPACASRCQPLLGYMLCGS